MSVTGYTKAGADAAIAGAITGQKGVANGLATLDSSGRVPASQLTLDAMEYKGAWNASTNTPTLANGTGNQGDFYKVSTGGSQNFGAGSITFSAGDSVLYDGSVWQRISSVDAADLSATYVGLPGGGIADYAVASRLTGQPNNITWTTKEEHVARAVGWTIATDPRYGVKGDGTTVDTTAWQAALTATPVGGTTFVPPNLTCIIDGSLVPNAGTRVMGYGSTIKTKSGIAGINLIHPTDGMEVWGLTVDPNKANTTDPGADTGGIGIYIYNATGFNYPVKLVDVTIKAGWQLGYRVATGVFSVDPASNPVSDVLIQNVNVDSQASRGARLLNLNGCKVIGGNVTNSGGDGLHVFSCADTNVTNTKFLSNAGHGLVTNYVARFTACGVLARANGLGGIVMGGGALTSSNTPSYDWNLIGCITNGNGTVSAYSGIHIDPTVTGLTTTSQPSYASITGCISAGNTVHGIYINNAGYVSVTGNVTPGNTNSGILWSASDGLCDGNVSTGNGQYGIYIAGHPTARNRVTVGVNHSTGNTVGDYSIDDATMDIRWARFGKAPLVKTANYSLGLTDYCVHMNGTSLTASLPDPTTIPAGSAAFLVKNLNASALTVNSLGTSKTIDGASSVSIPQYGSLKFYSDGSNWFTETNNVGSAAYVPLVASGQLLTANGSFTVPGSGTRILRITVVGGGAGGAGGGSALTSGGISNQVGGGGGGAGAGVVYTQSVAAGTVLTVTIGAGGSGGSGGAANSSPGGQGGAGGTTSVTGTGVNVYAKGGGGPSGGLANSSTAAGGGWPGTGVTAAVLGSVLNQYGLPGVGGQAANNVGYLGMAAIGVTGQSGGGAGTPASGTLGGVGGAAGVLGGSTSGVGYATGNSGTTTGTAGNAAAANSGCGGGGGGGGAPGGAGGAGGNGGSGWAIIEVIG